MTDDPHFDPTIAHSRDFGASSEHEGQLIGRYRLLEPLGKGGFGSVWAADQKEPVKRRVALKIIKLGMDTKQVIARFEAERQALAMMDHPHIAKVLDAGTTDTGRPYFAMELVRGVPILDFCDTNKVDTEGRLRLFISVCHAIQHAHQKGIIHRDIKPSNVLVTMHDGVPVPKVIDFGIAKATNQDLTDKTIYTRQRQMIGTPAYMAPEQAEMSGLDIDTRADIYSLGVLLYELLTGTTPFDNAELMERGFVEMMRVIRETEPQRPSTRLDSLGATVTETAARRSADPRRLSSQLTGDLDWITLKCLEKDRTRRYETASGVADDIVRHLSDQPVHAGPPSASYRLKKFVRRNRAGVVAASLVLGVLVVGVVGTTGGLLWALEQKERAELAEGEAERELVRAEAAEAEAQRELVRAEMAEGETQRELARANEVKLLIAGMLQGVTPEVAQGADTEILERVLEDTEARLQEGEIENPLVEAEIRTLLGGVYNSLGLLEQSRQELDRAYEIQLATHGPDAPETIDAEVERTRIAWDGADIDGYIERSLELLERVRALRGEDHESALNLMSNIGITCIGYRRLDIAEEMLEESLRVRRTLSDTPDSNTLHTMSALSGVYSQQLRFHEAEALIRETVQLWRETEGDSHPGTLRETLNLCNALMNAGKHTEAEPLLRAAYVSSQRINGPTHRATLLTGEALARALPTLGAAEEGIELRDEMLQRRVTTYGAEHRDTLLARRKLGVALMAMGELDRAESELRSLLEPTGRVFEIPFYAGLVRSLYGTVLTRQGRLDEAQHELEAGLEVMLEHEDPGSPHVFDGMDDLARVYRLLGQPDRAIATYRRVIDANREEHGEGDSRTLDARTRFAYGMMEIARYPEALEIAQDVLDRRSRSLGDSHTATLRSRTLIGMIYFAQGRFAEGLEHAQQAAEHAAEALGGDAREVLHIQRTLIGPLMAINRAQEAVPIAEKLLEQSRRIAGDQNPQVIGDMTNVGYARLHAGDAEGAIEMFLQSLPLAREVLGDDHQFTHNTLNHLSNAYDAAGRRLEAVATAGELKALILRSADAPGADINTVSNAAFLLLFHQMSELREPERALTFAQRAYDMDLQDGTANSLQAHDAYAQALFATGDYEKAVEIQHQVLSLVPREAQAAMRARLKQYTDALGGS